MNVSSAPQTEREAPFSSERFLSGLQSMRDLFAFLEAEYGSLDQALKKSRDPADRRLLLTFATEARRLNELLPQAEQAALRTISANQSRDNLSLQKPNKAAGTIRERAPQAIDLDRVVVIPKISKIEYYRRVKGLSFGQAVAEYARQDEDIDRLCKVHFELENSRKAIGAYFRPEQFADRGELNEERIRKASLLISLGGDDHFCFVSQAIRGELPILGLKADSSSTGFLLSSRMSELSCLIRQLESADYRFEPWTRLRVKVDGLELPATVSTVFVGDGHSQCVSRNKTYVEDKNAHRLHGTKEDGVEQRSSGVLIYTGTGSTGWALGASLYLYPEGRAFPRTARYAEMILREPGLSIVCDSSQDCSFDVRACHFQYPELNQLILHEGERICIKSLNKEGGIVNADSVVVPFPRGSTVEIEVDSEPLWVVVPNKKVSAI